MKKYNSQDLIGKGELVLHNGKVYQALRTVKGRVPSDDKLNYVLYTESVGSIATSKGTETFDAPAHNSKKLYKTGELCKVGDLCYRARMGNQGKTPADNPRYWEIMWESDKPITLPKDDRPDVPILLPKDQEPVKKPAVTVLVIEEHGHDGKDGESIKGDPGAPGKDGQDGSDGEDGIGLDFRWEGTSLGVKREDEEEYQFVDLKGPATEIKPVSIGGSSNKFKLSAATATGSTLISSAKPSAAELKTLIAGTNVTFDVTGQSITINASGGGGSYTDEEAQDAVGNAVGNGLDYDDTSGAISVDETELDHNTLAGKQGGTLTEYYHLTAAQNTLVAALDADLATFSVPASTTISAFGASLIDDAAASDARTTLGLGTAATHADTDFEVPITFSTGLTRSVNTVTVNTTQNIAKLSNLTSNGFVKTGSGDGTLSVDTNSYTVANAGITGATKTKITYDTKGLVTAGADATTADIADSSNKRYVTDAQLVVIGNTSGTNTGDQTSIVGITGTKAQFDTACTDGNFLYVGDITQYTDELAQDAINAMLIDTNTIDFTYTDGTPELKFDVRTQMSLTSDASGIKLSGDATTPGNSKYYGTDSGGTKGFFDLPAGLGVPTTITVANEATDTTCFPAFFTAATGDLGPKTNASLTFNSNTANLACTTFTGALSGNATTATALATPRTIGGVSFDGSANIVPQTIESANEATDTTCFPLFITASGTQQLQPKNNTTFTFNSNTSTLAATNLTGTLTTASQTNITGVGTLTTGTWSATTIAVDKGGTGQTSYTNGQLLIGNTTGNTLTKATLTAGNGIGITNGTGSITITADSASDTVDGVVELATAAETTTGTDATRAVTPDGLAGSDYGKREVCILVSDPQGSAITTGDGKAVFTVPASFNGYNLVTVAMSVSTVSSSGIPTVQLRRSRRASNTTRTDADMLSTKLTVDASEFSSVDAAAAAVIDTANDDVNTGDMIFIDIDVAGTGTKGLQVVMTFQLP